jgi:hypothetical protein
MDIQLLVTIWVLIPTEISSFNSFFGGLAIINVFDLGTVGHDRPKEHKTHKIYN